MNFHVKDPVSYTHINNSLKRNFTNIVGYKGNCQINKLLQKYIKPLIRSVIHTTPLTLQNKYYFEYKNSLSIRHSFIFVVNHNVLHRYTRYYIVFTFTTLNCNIFHMSILDQNFYYKPGFWFLFFLSFLYNKVRFLCLLRFYFSISVRTEKDVTFRTHKLHIRCSYSMIYYSDFFNCTISRVSRNFGYYFSN